MKAISEYIGIFVLSFTLLHCTSTEQADSLEYKFENLDCKERISQWKVKTISENSTRCSQSSSLNIHYESEDSSWVFLNWEYSIKYPREKTDNSIEIILDLLPKAVLNSENLDISFVFSHSAYCNEFVPYGISFREEILDCVVLDISANARYEITVIRGRLESIEIIRYNTNDTIYLHKDFEDFEY